MRSHLFTLIVSMGILFFSIVSIDHFPCDDTASCHDYHLSQIGFNETLHRRCHIPNGQPAYVDFTHIPKAGGTTVVLVLSKLFSNRYSKAASPNSHNNFATEYDYLKNKANDTTFLTIFRDPVDLEISFYNYVNAYSKIPAHLHNNLQWKSTFRANPIKWSKRNFGIISNYSTQLFIRDLDKVKYQPVVNVSLYDIEYAYQLPLQYQCLDQLRTVRFVMERYTVVGVLEKIQEMWSVLSARLNVPKKIMDQYSDFQINKNYQPVLNRTIEMFMREELKKSRHFYCADLLYHLIKRVAHQDYLCIAEKCSKVDVNETRLNELEMLTLKQTETLKLFQLKEQNLQQELNRLRNQHNVRTNRNRIISPPKTT